MALDVWVYVSLIMIIEQKVEMFIQGISKPAENLINLSICNLKIATKNFFLSRYL